MIWQRREKALRAYYEMRGEWIAITEIKRVDDGWPWIIVFSQSVSDDLPRWELVEIIGFN